MPGGQFTNLKEQAKSISIGEKKWDLIAKTYAEVNLMFGDIIKVTPTSKVVGDMALFMIANDLSAEGEPISTALQVSDTKVELGKDVVPTTDIFVLSEDLSYQTLIVGRGDGSDVNSQFKNKNYRLIGNNLESIRLYEIYKDNLNRYVLVFDRDLSLSGVSVGSNLGFTLFRLLVSHIDWICTVKPYFCSKNIFRTQAKENSLEICSINITI